MNIEKSYKYPKRIVCLTEESVETLFLLGEQERIVGVSAFVKRPHEATRLPKVSMFTSSHYKKIADLRPELIIGHSDIQKDIAKDLIELGFNVHIANHRSIHGILQYIYMLSRLCDCPEKGDKLLSDLSIKINKAQDFAKNLQIRPKVYFEEWDDPLISCIEWVGELLDLCGAEVIFKDKSQGVLAKERFVTHEEIIFQNPDIIFACWCGKKVKTHHIVNRQGYENINAVKYNRVFELAPEIFLQPGPAPIIDGIDIVIDYFTKFSKGEI